MSFEIRIGSSPPFLCAGHERVLIMMDRAGLREIPIGCRNGGCGLCKVRVEEGRYVTGPMSRAQVSVAEEADRIALACRLSPRSDLRLRAVIARIEAD